VKGIGAREEDQMKEGVDRKCQQGQLIVAARESCLHIRVDRKSAGYSTDV
jgi:hypothetical protein